MNHGGFVRFSRTAIRVPDDLIRPLFVSEGSVLYCAYHPDDKNTHHVDEFKWDFIVTPIRPQDWLSVARVWIPIVHKGGALAFVSDAIRNAGANILLAECTRSARTFAIWSLVLSFEGTNGLTPRDYADRIVQLMPNAKAIDERIDDDFHRMDLSLRKCIQRLKKQLNSEVTRDYVARGHLDFFQDPESPNSQKRRESPLQWRRMTALQHYYKRIVKRIISTKASRSRDFDPFPVTYSAGGIHIDSRVSRAYLNSVGTLTPTYGVAEMDTAQVYLRASLIPPTKLDQFREVRIQYTASAKQSASFGLLSYLTRAFNPDLHNLWRVVNQAIALGEPERGWLIFLAQSINASTFDEDAVEASLREMAREYSRAPNREAQLLQIRFIPFSPYRIFLSLRHEDKWRDEIIKSTRKELSRLGIRETDLIVVDEPGHVPIRTVASRIRDCDGLLQIRHLHDSKVNWLDAELLAAETVQIAHVLIATEEGLSGTEQGVHSGLTCVKLRSISIRAIRSAIREALAALLRLIEVRRRES